MKPLLTLLLVGLLAATPLRANEAAKTAEEASEMIAAARDKLASARTSRKQVRALVDAIRAYEVALVAMQGGLREIRSATLRAQERYNGRRDKVEQALVAIQSIEKASGAKRAWHPGGALSAARAGMTMADLLPILNGEAERLKAELSGLATLTALQEAAEDSMLDARSDMRQGLDDIQRAMVVKAALAPPPEDRARRLEELARNASELGELADGLAALAPVDLEDIGENPDEGSLKWPVRGTLLRDFSEADAAGVIRPGLILAAPPEALVMAPASAEVSYAGPFLEQKTVVILELSREYLVVLGGLGQSFVSTGDTVDVNTPIGILGDKDTSDEEFLIKFGNEDGAFASESLYIELRENGIAVDPTDWFEPNG